MVFHAEFSVSIHTDDELQYFTRLANSDNRPGSGSFLRPKEKLHGDIQIILLFCSLLDANCDDYQTNS
jgi:hypothetical protein